MQLHAVLQCGQLGPDQPVVVQLEHDTLGDHGEQRPTGDQFRSQSHHERFQRCGLATNAWDASHQYLGDTTRRANISDAATCASTFPDGYNTINFGTLTSLFAVTCTKITGGRILEADVKIDTTHQTWFIGNNSCAGYKYDLEGIMTHEMGHVLGQKHVGETRATNVR